MKIKDILASVGLPNTAAGKKKFYEMYPDEDSYKMAMGGPVSSILGGLGYPYGLLEKGGMPCMDCDPFMAEGGGLDRDQDFGSEKKPYPSVSKGDFAGGGRSYPIPTRADAVDALRLAGLHGRSDVRAKVFAKYPDLKKEFGGDIEGFLQTGGTMTADLEGTYPMFNVGGGDLSMSDFRKYLGRVKKEGGASFPGEGEQEIIAKRKNDFLQTLTENYDNHVMNTMQEEGFFAAGGSQDNGMNALMNFLAQRGQGDGYTYMPYNQRGYGMGKKDFARFSKLPASTQFQGISKVNYGLMGRLAPKLFGPKSIEFNTRNAYEDNMKMQPTDEASIRKMLKMSKQKKSDYQGPYPETETAGSQMTESQDASYYDVPALNDDVRAAQIRDMGNPNSPIHMNQPNNITLNPTY